MNKFVLFLTPPLSRYESLTDASKLEGQPELFIKIIPESMMVRVLASASGMILMKSSGWPSSLLASVRDSYLDKGGVRNSTNLFIQLLNVKSVF